MKLSDAKSLWLDHLVPHMHFEEIMDTEAALLRGDTTYVDVVQGLVNMAVDDARHMAREMAHEAGVEFDDDQFNRPPEEFYAWAIEAVRKIEHHVAVTDLVTSAYEASGDAWKSTLDFGEWLYFELVGHGIQWTDDHPDYPLHEKIEKIYLESPML